MQPSNPILDAPAVREARSKARHLHIECEDAWYSCPLSPEGCANDSVDVTKCNCGADERNIALDAFAAAILAEVRKRVETMEGARITTTLDNDMCGERVIVTVLVDRAAVLALLDGRDV